MNPLRKFYEEHPKFRKNLNSVGTIFNSLGILYWIGAAIYISAVALALYTKLPDKLKVPVTTIVTSALTTIIIPLIINHIQLKKEQKENVYERNLPFYKELIDKMLDVLHEGVQTEQRQKIVILSNFIAQEYTSLCIKLPAQQLEMIFNIKDECNLFFASNEKAKASLENLKKYTQAIIKDIRKQGNISGNIFISDFMTKKLEMPAPGNMNPPSNG